MKRPLYILTFIILIIITLTVIRVSIVNSISTTGAELAMMQNDISAFKKQNTLLKEQYLEISSYTNIEEKAKKLGFVDSKLQLYLSTPLPLALKQ